MSTAISSLVWRTSPEGGNTLVLALVCAHISNDEGKNIRCGAEKLAAMCRMSVRTVQRLMHRMVDSGWLIQVRNSWGGHKMSPDSVNEYVFNPEWVNGAMIPSFSSTGDKLSPVTDKPVKDDLPVTNSAFTGDTVTGEYINPIYSNNESVLVESPERASAPLSDFEIEIPKSDKGEALALLESLGVDHQRAVDWLVMRRDGGFKVRRRNLDAMVDEAKRAGILLDDLVAIWLERGERWATFRADWPSVQDSIQRIKLARRKDEASRMAEKRRMLNWDDSTDGVHQMAERFGVISDANGEELTELVRAAQKAENLKRARNLRMMLSRFPVPSCAVS